jgi:hypothetical protein
MEMGTYYGLGVIQEFTASYVEKVYDRSLSKEEWERILSERVDLSLFDVDIQGKEVTGSLLPNIFSENIIDFYRILKEIAGPRRSKNINSYEKKYGTDLNEYPTAQTSLFLSDSDGYTIRMDITFVPLFVEGKVLVEEFNTEPHIINWLW